MNIGAILKLVRPPNVFTAFADAIAGLLIARAAGVDIAGSECLLILASGCLYLAGIVFNDIFDRDIDAQERPERPIPSGAVSLRLASALGTGLIGVGLGLAWSVSTESGLIGVALIAAIFAYDGFSKHHAIGPVNMGLCRSLNFLLGLSPMLAAGGTWAELPLTGPIVLGLYVCCLTYIARDEVQGNSVQRARRGLIAMAAVAGLSLVAVVWCPHAPKSVWAWPWIVAVLVMAYRNWSPLWAEEAATSGRTTGRAIGGGILLIPIIDAAISATMGEPFWALAVAGLAVPAVILKSWFSPT